MPLRLQLGAGRFENIDPVVVKIFANRTWIHLGDKPHQATPLLDRLKGKSVGLLWRMGVDKVGKIRRNKAAGEVFSGAYELTDFRTFMFELGDILPFADESFDFVYSEHFFEHIFVDEAVALFTECLRVMRPGAVIRTCVPDAELKTHEKPEFAGFPDPKMPFTHPLKHKNRWTVYSLSEILRLVGFLPVPLVYYTKTGEFIQKNPTASDYPGNPDMESTMSLDYVVRRCSLIVDGKKPTIAEMDNYPSK